MSGDKERVERKEREIIREKKEDENLRKGEILRKKSERKTNYQ